MILKVKTNGSAMVPTKKKDLSGAAKVGRLNSGTTRALKGGRTPTSTTTILTFAKCA